MSSPSRTKHLKEPTDLQMQLDICKQKQGPARSVLTVDTYARAFLVKPCPPAEDARNRLRAVSSKEQEKRNEKMRWLMIAIH
jgi:hypothetical protein